MKNIKSITLGILIGSVTTLSITALAEYIVVPNSFPVKVNGVETTIQGYNINDETYFKLRDVSAAVGGFEVGFEDNAIIVNTPQKPTPAPTSMLSDVPTETVDGIDYIRYTDILTMLNSIGIDKYTFGTTSLIDTSANWKKVITDIPLCPTNEHLILSDFYYSTIVPYIESH